MFFGKKVQNCNETLRLVVPIGAAGAKNFKKCVLLKNFCNFNNFDPSYEGLFFIAFLTQFFGRNEGRGG